MQRLSDLFYTSELAGINSNKLQNYFRGTPSIPILSTTKNGISSRRRIGRVAVQGLSGVIMNSTSFSRWVCRGSGRCGCTSSRKVDRQKVTGEMLSLEKKGTVHRVVKMIIGKNRDVVEADCVKGSDGKTITDEDEVKDMWK